MLGKRSIRLGSAVLLAFALGLGLGPLTRSAVAAGQILCVQAPAQPTTSPCTNVTSFPTAQAAADTAGSGDEIRIAVGTYQGSAGSVLSVSNLLASLTITGGYVGGVSPTGWTDSAPTGTVLDGQAVNLGLLVNGSTAVTIQ